MEKKGKESKIEVSALTVLQKNKQTDTNTNRVATLLKIL